MRRTHRVLTRWRGCTRRRAGPKHKLGYLGHVLTENRNGLVVDVRLTQATEQPSARRRWRCWRKNRRRGE